MKHIFIEIDLRISGDEVTSKAVFAIEDKEDIELYAEKYVKNFWGEGEEEWGSEWVTYPNENLGRLRRVEQITEAEYEVLKRFM